MVQIHLEVVTPTGPVISDEVDIVTAPGHGGEFGVLANHAPFLSTIKTGTLSFKKDKQTKYFGFSCHDGNVVELMNKAASIGSDAINAIMFRYSFSEYGNLELNKAMDACAKAGIGLLAMKAQDLAPEDNEIVPIPNRQSASSFYGARIDSDRKRRLWHGGCQVSKPA